jgi:hypothetical protein
VIPPHDALQVHKYLKNAPLRNMKKEIRRTMGYLHSKMSVKGCAWMAHFTSLPVLFRT